MQNIPQSRHLTTLFVNDPTHLKSLSNAAIITIPAAGASPVLVAGLAVWLPPLPNGHFFSGGPLKSLTKTVMFTFPASIALLASLKVLVVGYCPLDRHPNRQWAFFHLGDEFCTQGMDHARASEGKVALKITCVD
ncbi:MAG: hypothetical protein JRH15_20305 [Deltaproteobacteria bacterium]|nr:hypothetical protein [Deltaproteobacteria bacterium]